jgi:hypothetical protein
METKKLSRDELKQIASVIENKNISAQYQEMRELLDLDQSYAEMFETFRQARNCLAHRRGVVAKRDDNTGEELLKLSWCFIGTHIRLPDGTEQLIDNDALNEGVTVEEGGQLIARLTWKEKKFAVGSQIKLTRHDLGEVCLGVHLATIHVLQKMVEFARAHGIPDVDLQEAEKATTETPPEASAES